MKSAVTVILLVFVAVSVVYLVVEGRSRPPQPQSDTAPLEPSVAAVGERPSPENAPAPARAAPGERQPEANAASVAETADALPQDAAASQRKVIGYYFHRSQRCRKCLAMEAYAEEALREGLSEAMESGQLEWLAVNVEEPEHEHFVGEYQLVASALVVVETERGKVTRSKKLERIWDLVDRRGDFQQYVLDEVGSYLESTP